VTDSAKWIHELSGITDNAALVRARTEMQVFFDEEIAKRRDRPMVLLSFSAANRDPNKFPGADRVVIDRPKNPHVAFGLGIHRCIGSNLARMEINVALNEWLARIPEFRLDPAIEVKWSEGTVRGPRRLPVLFG